MNITIINDCRDDNAAGRQKIRVRSLFNQPATFIGVKSDLEAAGNLVDALDAQGEKEGVILVNVAPRDGDAKKWENGTPFAYFWYKKVLVVASIDGLTLSLVKKLGLTKTVRIMDIPRCLEIMIEKGYLSDTLKEQIAITQFRSYNFVPRIGYYLSKEKEIEGEDWEISQVPDAPQAIWWVDSFGNCKTTVFSDEFILEKGKEVETNLGKFTLHTSLKDVADKHPALIEGSSGLGHRKFMELVLQGGHAAGAYKLRTGDKITIPTTV